MPWVDYTASSPNNAYDYRGALPLMCLNRTSSTFNPREVTIQEEKLHTRLPVPLEAHRSPLRPVLFPTASSFTFTWTMGQVVSAMIVRRARMVASAVVRRPHSIFAQEAVGNRQRSRAPFLHPGASYTHSGTQTILSIIPIAHRVAASFTAQYCQGCSQTKSTSRLHFPLAV